MKNLLSIVCLSLMFLNSCASLPGWNKEPIKFSHFTVPGTEMKVFVFPNLRELEKYWHNSKGKRKWGFGHSMDSGLKETRPYYSVGGSRPLFKQEIYRGEYIEKYNLVLYVIGDTFACEHELEYAKESKKWDNSLIEVNEVCF